jgi:hypothetical protein
LFSRTKKIDEDLIGYIAGDGESAGPLAAARRVNEPVTGSGFDKFEPGLAEQFFDFGFGPVAYGSPPCRTDRRDITHLRPLLPENRHKAAIILPCYDYCSATVT